MFLILNVISALEETLKDLFYIYSKISEYTGLIYLCELNIKYTTESNIAASFFDCYPCIDNGKLVTSLYGKRDDFNCPIINFPCLSSNIPSASAYGVYVSQLVRYATAYCKRGKLHTNNFLLQCYRRAMLESTSKKFYGRHHDLIDPYSLAVSKLISDLMDLVEA